jgi:hypothetical protein
MPETRCPLHGLASLLLLAALLPCAVASADPSTADCLSAYEESINLRNRHELRSSRAQLLVCVAPTCPEDVRNECARRIGEVNSQLPTIVIEAKDSAGNDVSAVSVSMDGHQWVESLEGTALAIDPGEHLFVFTVEGWPPIEKRWVIREGEKERHEKIVLIPQPPPPEPEPQPVPVIEVPAPAIVPAPVTAPLPEPEHTRRTAGIIVTAIGVAALGVGLYEQISAHNRYADSQAAARNPAPTVRANTHALYEDAKHAQTAAIIVGAIGIAALAPGAYLLLSSWTESQPRTAAALQVVPWFGPGSAGVHYARSF